jgi:hypothetical protein
MERTSHPVLPPDDDFELPLDRSGASWRFGLAGVLFALCLLQVLPRGRGSDPDSNPYEWAPVALVVFLPQAIALLLSGLGVRRGWSPHLFFRLLPLFPFLGVLLLGIALDAC